MRLTPNRLIVSEHFVSIGRIVRERLGGVAILEDVCHRGGL